MMSSLANIISPNYILQISHKCFQNWHRYLIRQSGIAGIISTSWKLSYYKKIIFCQLWSNSLIILSLFDDIYHTKCIKNSKLTFLIHWDTNILIHKSSSESHHLSCQLIIGCCQFMLQQKNKLDQHVGDTSNFLV